MQRQSASLHSPPISPGAVELLDAVQAAFPQAIRPPSTARLSAGAFRQLEGSEGSAKGTVRAGRARPETVGIYARTWMDAYDVTGNRIVLRRSRHLYAEGFAKCPNDFYPGINVGRRTANADAFDATRRHGWMRHVIRSTHQNVCLPAPTDVNRAVAITWKRTCCQVELQPPSVGRGM